ncbi:MAG TPA: hypothetical protein VFA10_01590 [Ktedonobacteraceae bacterium]|nr:hypothetical protein [Ktedonobacteraceae bacterium]
MRPAAIAHLILSIAEAAQGYHTCEAFVGLFIEAIVVAVITQRILGK